MIEIDNSANVLPTDLDSHIKYLHFCRPANAFKTPLIILCNVFQTFDQFKDEVAYLSKDIPVYLVALPGLGESEMDGEGIDFEDYADILYRFTSKLGIEKTSIKSLSATSPIGLWFAVKYPRTIDNLIIGGSSRTMRDANRRLFKNFSNMFKDSSEKSVGQKFISNIFNFDLYEGDRDKYVKRCLVSKRVGKSNDLEKRKISNQLTRWMNNHLPLRGPLCRTLVLSADQDQFMTPYENFELSRICVNSQLGIFKGQDHYSLIGHSQILTKVCYRFLLEKSINRLSDFTLYGKKTYPAENRRVHQRYNLEKSDGQLYFDGQENQVEIIDINTQGVRLSGKEQVFEMLKNNPDAMLSINGDTLQYNILVFRELEGDHFAALFAHRSIKEIQRLHSYLEDNAQII